jgi:alpha-beta hydrolase superfamily lysophospholipase
MVFNYSGYGASSGKIRSEHCDEDLVSAYAELRRRIGSGVPLFVLGFSLGSGIAASGVGMLEPPPAGLILCESFTSFQDAVRSAGFPHWLARELPDVWNTVVVVASAQLPVCVVHSDGDRLFPLKMPRRIAKACGDRGELIVVAGLAHNEPYLKPTDAYWGPIVAWMTRQRKAGVRDGVR